MSLSLITQHGSARSPLLRLPPELRTIIYEFALGGHLIETMVQLNEVAALRYTCRQICAEIGYLHFRLNVFTTRIGKLFTPFNIYNHAGLQHIREMAINMRYFVPHLKHGLVPPRGRLAQQLEDLGKLDGLEVIHIISDRWQCPNAKVILMTTIERLFNRYRTTTQPVNFVLECKVLERKRRASF